MFRMPGARRNPDDRCGAWVRSVLLAAATVDIGQGAGHDLPPAWSASFPEVIEWVQVVGPPSEPALLVATAVGHLHLVEPGTGKALLPAPLAAGRGVRPADADGAPADTMYCFDRHALYALRVTPPAGVKWQSGQAPKTDDYPGDPEQLRRRVGAAATPEGLLVVDSDGGVRLLDASDGRERWRVDVGPLRTARLLVSGPAAVILAGTADRLRAIFLDLSKTPPVAAATAVPGGWPIWCRLTDHQLILLTPPQVFIQPHHGPPRAFSLEVSRVRAAATALYEPTSYPATMPASAPCNEAPDGPRLIVAGGPHLHAYDLSSGRCVWSQHVAVGQTSDVESVGLRGDQFVAVYGEGVIVGSVLTGRIDARWDAPLAARLVSWELRDKQLWVLFRDAADTGAPLRLVRVRLTMQPESGPTESTADVDLFSLASHAAPRATLWTEEYVVLVETSALHAFRLP